MKRPVIHGSRILMILLLAGCSQGNAKYPASLQKKPGIVHEKVFCHDHPGFSYALYIPSTYKEADTLPVVLAFDPGGFGQIPVKNYQELAEKYRFILIGSLDSRNGQGSDRTEEIAFAMFREIRKYLPSQRNRLYLLGFSGGSRVAAQIAFYRGGIKGVIGCGAGFPSFDAPLRHKADYYGLVGNMDFNYLEMIRLQGGLSRIGVPHSLHIFEGDHDWPPVEDMERAFRWHEYRAMALGLCPPEILFSDSVREQIVADSLTMISLDETNLEREEDLQLRFLEAMPSQPVSWWKKQLAKTDEADSKGDTLLNYRLRSYISMLAYTFSNQAVRNSDRSTLGRIIPIYELVDPQNKYIDSLKVKLERLP